MQHLQQAHTLGVTVAIENLAPVFPGPRRLCHDPIAVRDLVRRLAAPAGGMLLDLGHLHVTSRRRRQRPRAGRGRLRAGRRPLPRARQLRRAHGARTSTAPGVDPLRLDLHLAPGAGTLPWSRIAPVVAGHAAPLLLEVHPQHRPALARAAGRDRRAADAQADDRRRGMTRDGQQIAVAIHDVEPATFEKVALVRDWLDDHGIDRATLLVVPAPDLHPLQDRDEGLVDWLAERRRSGDAIAQHGLRDRCDRRGAGRRRAARAPAARGRGVRSCSTRTRPAARSSRAGGSCGSRAWSRAASSPRRTPTRRRCTRRCRAGSRGGPGMTPRLPPGRARRRHGDRPAARAQRRRAACAGSPRRPCCAHAPRSPAACCAWTSSPSDLESRRHVAAVERVLLGGARPHAGHARRSRRRGRRGG